MLELIGENPATREVIVIAGLGRSSASVLPSAPSLRSPAVNPLRLNDNEGPLTRTRQSTT